ncbi:MAG TPA: EamA family transporter [Spirochaetales bacterium]|nr:EamA family transporter [Spirochaetales bacterium]HRY53222.1 EamA family transporter [Spirochaetia bacterium]HRZ63645.1 EamA family transporter [Spirochaetia bacterium]
MRIKTGGEGAGLAAMAGCAVLWSLAGIFIKLVDWNPFAIACGRSLIASAFLAAWIGKPKLTFSRVQVGAALASAATMLLFIYANKATSSANAILLQYSSPVYTTVIGLVLLKERPRAEQWVALAAVLGGMALFFMDELGGGQLAGNLAAAASGLSFALYIVLMRAQKEGSPLESALLAHLATAAIALGVALFLPAPRLTARALGAMLGLGILQISLATVLFSYGIKRITAVQSVLVAGLEPVLNPLWVFLATGERPSARTLAGGGVIIAAVLASSVITARRDAAAARRASARQAEDEAGPAPGTLGRGGEAPGR